jgi:hypothetical protein
MRPAFKNLKHQNLRIRRFVLAMAIFVFTSLPGAPAGAQIFTGSISGTVVDTSGGSVPEAGLTLNQARTGLSLKTATDAGGRFVFPSLEPGEYTLTIEKAGFKTVAQTSIVLQTGERLALGAIALTLGAVTETVSVTAEAVSVKTDSSERAGQITGTQVDQLLMRGRNVANLISLLPGVAEAAQSNILDRNGGTFNVQGSRSNTNRVMIDGIPSTDIDNGGSLKMQESADAISEVTVLQSNYQAEYGAAGSGAIVIIVAKSGTKDFHGGASYFVKNEFFDANNFFNNRNNVKRPRNRTNNWNYSIGGPVLLGKLNRNRDKLFFFWNQEFWPGTYSTVSNFTVPTDLERIGDFSQSLDTNGALRIIKDPSAGSPFAQNTIPTNRLDPNGRALLNIFPHANFFDRTVSKGAYNYVVTTQNRQPNRMRTLKVDYNVSSKDRLNATWTGFAEISQGYGGTSGNAFSGPLPLAWINFEGNNNGLAARWTRTFSPTTVNELGFGWQGNPETANPATQQDFNNLLRSTWGFNPGMLSTKGNPLGFLPSTSFGGVPNAATTPSVGGYVWLPYESPSNIYIWTDKLSAVRGKHWLKAGVEIQRFWRDFPGGSSRFGNYAFDVSPLNPLDTNYAYSNAILGTYMQYRETNGIPRQYARAGYYDTFVQDTWKVTSRFTLDFGIRFEYLIPLYLKDNAWAAFIPSRYDPSKAIQLFQPGLDANGNRVAVNPVTGQTFNQAVIGAIAPGVGVKYDGMVSPSLDSSFERGTYRNQGIQYGPRFGFAWDVFGNHKTAVRGGGGIYYSPVPMGNYRGLTSQPPLLETPTLLFGQLSNLQSSTAFTFPSTVSGSGLTGTVPTTMNFSLGVQRDLGFGTILDVAYVGSLARHLSWTRNLNSIPFGRDFAAANQDPTTGRPLTANLLRPIPGYADILSFENASSSNYHSLQVTANRRLGKRLTFGAAYTWSRARDFVSSDGSAVSTLVPIRQWNYGLADFDQTHALKINWLWSLPQSSWRNAAAKLALNDWQVSGIASFVSGRPTNVSLSTTTPIDITGSPTDGPRSNVTGDPILSSSDRTFSHAFRTEAFTLPAVGTYGNAGRAPLRSPGINNWDVAFFKTISFREKISVQLRAEMYNLFNHTQFSSFDTGARFDPATGQQVNPGFGQYTAARDPRRMQLGARVSF